MAEPTCVMQAFSHAPVISNQATELQDNPMYGLEESASLGRFMSESLSWEKWSTFSRNRYVEEAEKSSKPGSVMQKKAYFEAHFKRKAALKAAAVLVEQPNTPQAELHQQQETTVSGYHEHDKKDGQEETANEEGNSGFAANNKEYSPKEHVIDIIQKQNPSTEMETGLGEMKESCLKVCPSIGHHTCVSATLENKTKPVGWKSPTSSAIPTKSMAKPPAVHPGKENSWTPVGRKSSADDSEKKRTPLRVSFNREFNRLISPVIKKIGGSLSASNKDCSSPPKSPIKASGDAKETSPRSGRRRARAIFDSSGPRWQFLSEVGAKSPCSGRKKTTTPVASKVFELSVEKVSRRKEKLEEKFNPKAMENHQDQSNLKEKPKEHSKLRQTFCFGAKLSNGSSGERRDWQFHKRRLFA